MCNVQCALPLGKPGSFAHHLHRCNQLLRLHLNFWELSDVVAHTAVVAKVDLANHDDDAGGEGDGFLAKYLVMTDIIPCKPSRCRVVGW